MQHLSTKGMKDLLINSETSMKNNKMEQVNFETSMKNIPLGGKKEYAMQLTHSIRKVVYAISNLQ